MNRLFLPSLLLTLLLVSMVSISELFQNPALGRGRNKQHKNPFNASFLEGVTQIHITNRLGELVVGREEENEEWFLTHPREIEANPTTVERLMEALANLRIRKVYIQDQIHMANFSLENPVVTLSLTNPQLGTQTLKMGVINPLDESSYIMLGNNGNIYQIDSFKYPIESYTLSDFIDARVIALDAKEIRSIDLFDFQRGKKQQLISFTKNESNGWIDNNETPLSSEKVKFFLQRLTSFRGQMILDKKTGAQGQKIVNSYLLSPRYFLEFREKDQQVRHYEISDLIGENIPDLKINKQENIVLRASDRQHLYIVGKDFLDLLQTSEKEFRKTQNVI